MPVALVIAVVSVLSTPFSILDAWDAAATVQLEWRFRAMRRAGEPVTLAELAKTYPDPPKGQNAAVPLKRAFELMEKLEGREADPFLPIVGEAKLPPPDEELPRPMRGAIQAYLKDTAEILKLLHEAAKLEGCKFDLKLEDGVDMLLPHLSKVRQGARLLALEAIERTEAGDADKAAESLVAALRLGRALKDEPVLISGLVRVASDAIAARQVERWASRGGPSAKALERVETALRAEADPKLMHRLIIGERCFGMNIYQTHVLDPAKLDELAQIGGDMPAGPLVRLIPRAYFKSDMVAYIDIMSEYVAAGRRPYPQSLIQAGRVGKNLDQRIPRYYIISRMILPALGRMFIEGQRHMARLESARTGLAALRYRAKNGRLPEKLDALAPGFVNAVPVDPFNGKPLLYRKGADGFVIYAVGDNGRDDGGQTERQGGKGPDIGFRVRWPKAEF